MGELKSRPQGALPSSTELPRNLGSTGKEQCQVVMLRSRKTVADEKKKPRRTALIVMGQQTPLTQEETEEQEMMEPKIAFTSKPKEQGTVKIQLPPFPQRLKKKKNEEVQYQCFMDMMKQLHINIPFTEAIKQMPKYAKFLKDMVTKKRSTSKFATVALTQRAKTIIPLKMCDTGSFIIPCSIGGLYIGQAFAISRPAST
ncbi:uncharacterized protein LOC120084105 [Benincasa hispida]|uniref:uncharacterized protein LOC120084105 n=1 Tax=Benincasa hispida TaxID=102211 RepID=UPI001900E132|nr:uncharacterized protein LOC120084105 [Benincasa hispida]